MRVVLTPNAGTYAFECGIDGINGSLILSNGGKSGSLVLVGGGKIELTYVAAFRHE
jgi:hypothetical protein